MCPKWFYSVPGNRKAQGHSLGPVFILLCLFHVPTRLADGFGLKEPPYLGQSQEFTPKAWFPRSSAED